MDKNEMFSENLLRWYDKGHRDLPWRHTDDPYRIWISEIMLQQTRAKTVIGYYERFLNRFPDIKALADAPEADLLKCWEGLGYYSRARNLQKAARIVMEKHGGRLPADPAALRALPGIGDYTAGAVSSIAFGIPEPAVDGNVERVLARYHLIKEAVGLPAVREKLRALAAGHVPADRPGDFANAMMELGSEVCTPKNPACLLCPMRESCLARQNGCEQELPVRLPKKPQTVIPKAVLLIFCGGRVLVLRRKEKLLGGLYSFPDADGISEPAELCAAADALGLHTAFDRFAGNARHVFTHRIWEMSIWVLEADRMVLPDSDAVWADAAELTALPMPTAVRAAREKALEILKQ